MFAKQGLGQQQQQIQTLKISQQMQQSIQVLKYNTEELHDFLANAALENPFMTAAWTFKEKKTLLASPPDWSDLIETKSQSLFDYLMDQVNLTMRDTPIKELVIYLISLLDSNGYLNVDLNKLIKTEKIDKTVMLDALTLLQQLDPPGVGARNLQECLILQIQYDEHAPAQAEDILSNDFKAFTERNWGEIAKKYQITLSEIQSILDYVRTLSPAPGAAYSQEKVGYIEPDLVVTKEHGTLNIALTRENQPQIRFKNEYYEDLKKAADKDLLAYLEKKRKDYHKILEDVTMRGQTILKIGEAIIEKQAAFFLNDDANLKPFLLRDVAQKLQMHESTISRAVNGKYLLCNQGVFELKHFFSQAVAYHSASGSEITSDGVKEKIKALIEQEDKHHPLSDQKIVTLLSAEGLKVSRRTVAKYREQLKIAPSSKRKRY